MKTILKYAAATALTGVLAVIAATPSQARWQGSSSYNGVANTAYRSYYDYSPNYAYNSGPGYSAYAYAPDSTYGYAPYWHSGSQPRCLESPASLNYLTCK